MNEQPVTDWIRGVGEGRRQSEDALWDHYFGRVVRLARTRMLAIQSHLYDEEDAALSALNSVFRGIRNNRFPELRSRDNLWRLLILITHRKITAQQRRESARVRPASQGEAAIEISEIMSTEPTAELVMEMMDETDRLLKRLGDNKLRRIALMRMDGLTTQEIAESIKSTTRTVRRKLERIRDLWEIPEDD